MEFEVKDFQLFQKQLKRPAKLTGSSDVSSPEAESAADESSGSDESSSSCMDDAGNDVSLTDTFSHPLNSSGDELSRPAESDFD